MVFYYFPTKDELFLAVVEETYACVLERVEAVLSREEGSLRGRLRDLSALLGCLSDEEIQVVRLVAREALLSSARFDSLFARFKRGHLAALLRALSRGVEARELDGRLPVPVLMLATLGLIAVPQFVRRAVGGLPPFDALPLAEDLADALVDVMFGGVEPKGKTARSSPSKEPARGSGRKAVGARERTRRPPTA